MPVVPDQLLDRAQRFDPAALRTVLGDAYPSVRRIAVAVTAREDLGDAVVERVMTRALRVLPSWRHGAAPENWFYHHTLLAARAAVAAERGDLDPLTDALASSVARGLAAPDPKFLAFVRALRSLPPQQCEAFLLHHCERLNPRYLGIAMDCSTAAAEAHLRAANAAMAAIAGDGIREHVGHVFEAYHRYDTHPALVDRYVDRHVRQFLRAARRRRFFRRFLVLALVALLAGAAYAAWRWWDIVQPVLDRALPRPATRPVR